MMTEFYFTSSNEVKICICWLEYMWMQKGREYSEDRTETLVFITLKVFAFP